MCEGAIVRHRGELSNCQRRCAGMTDEQLRRYASSLDEMIRDPKNASRRWELCEFQQVCRHERLCDRHFPGTEPVPSPSRPADEQLSGADFSIVP